MMDEEIRQALTEVREMKKMCGNINMKLTNIVTQRGQNCKAKLDAEYQRGFEDGKAVSDKGCAGCEYAGKIVMGPPCISCCNSYKNQWTAKSDKNKIEVGDELIAYGGSKCIATVADYENDIFYVMFADGSCGKKEREILKKTGRHFDIASILEEMKHD